MLLRLTVPLVMLMVRVLQVMVLRARPCVGGRWPVLGVGACHSWRRVLPVLLANWSAGAGGFCRLRCFGGSSPILAEGAAGDVNDEGAGIDATVHSVLGDADCAGAVVDVPGGGAAEDADSEGAAVGATLDGAAAVDEREGVAGEAPGVGVAGDANGEGAAVLALGDGAVGVAFSECRR